MFRYKPTNEQAGEETADGQEYLTRDEVEEAEQALAIDGEETPLTQGHGTEHSDNPTGNGDYPSCAVAGGLELFLEECRAHLMKGYQRGEGSQRQEGIEHQGDEEAHDGHRNKGLFEDVGQGDEDERRTTVWAHTYGGGGREYHESG